MLKKSRGIVLITSLLILTIVMMIVTLLLDSSTNAFKLAASYNEGEQAYYAAISGAEYARAKVSTCATWMQQPVISKDAKPIHIVANSDGNKISIDEDPSKSSVIGRLIDRDKEKARFEIYFVDNSKFDSSAALNTVPYQREYINGLSLNNGENVRYYSCNNFFNNSSEDPNVPNRTVVRLERKGNTAFSSNYRKVPPSSMLLVVKGVSGKTVKFLETAISMDRLSDLDTSSVVKGSIKVHLTGVNPGFYVNAEKTDLPPTLRALGLDLNSENHPNKDGGIYVDTFGSPHMTNNCFVSNHKGAKAFAPHLFINDTLVDENVYEGNVQHTYGVNIDPSDTESGKTNAILEEANRIDWKTVANSKHNSYNQLESGAYIYNNEDHRWYHYSDIEIDKANNCVYLKSKPSKLSNPLITKLITLDKDKGNPRFTLKQSVNTTSNLFIASLDKLPENSSNTSSEYNGIISISGTAPHATSISDTHPLEVVFSSNKSPVLTVGDASTDPLKSSNFIACGKIVGSGKIFSSGDISFESGSYFSSVPNSGVSFYAENDIKVMPSHNTKQELVAAAVKTAWEKLQNRPNSFKNVGEVVKKLMESKVGPSKQPLRDYLKHECNMNGYDVKSFLYGVVSGNSSWGEEQQTSDDIMPNKDFGLGAKVQNAPPPEPNPKPKNYKPPYTPYSDMSQVKWTENIKNYKGLSTSVSIVSADKAYYIKQEGRSTATQTMKPLGESSSSYYRVWCHSYVENGSNPKGNTQVKDLFIYIPTAGKGAIYMMYGRSDNLELKYDTKYNNAIYGYAATKRIFYQDMNRYGLKRLDNGCAVNFNKLISSLQPKLKSNDLPKFDAYYSKVTANKDDSYNPCNGTDLADTLKSFLTNVQDGYSQNNNPNYFQAEFAPKSTSPTPTPTPKYTYQSLNSVGHAPKYELKLKDLDLATVFRQTLVKGMLFSKKGNFIANDAKNSLTVLGGIVTCNGGIDVNSSIFNLCYNPNYMDFISNSDGVYTVYKWCYLFNGK